MDVTLIDTRLGRLRVRVSSGGGAPIVFWPSLLMTGDMWVGQASHFSDRYRVVVVDPPGHGGSEPLTEMFSFDDCASCVVEILDDLGIDEAHFVGSSWGGMIGGTFAARYPERIGRAVLMNCAATAAGRREKIRYALMLRSAQLSRGIRPPVTGLTLKAFFGPTTFNTRQEVVKNARSHLKEVNIASSGWAIKSVLPARPDQHTLFAQIKTPVLVVAGSEDATFPVSDVRRMADAIPTASFVELDRVAHTAAMEDPGRVNSLIEQFLFQLDAHDIEGDGRPRP
jgi:3-oxoadipate enol-lactonase